MLLIFGLVVMCVCVFFFGGGGLAISPQKRSELINAAFKNYGESTNENREIRAIFFRFNIFCENIYRLKLWIITTVTVVKLSLIINFFGIEKLQIYWKVKKYFKHYECVLINSIFKTVLTISFSSFEKYFKTNTRFCAS